MMTSTSLNSSSTCSRYQRRNFCAWSTRGAGIIAPAISRSRTAGSKSFGALAQPIEMQRRAFGGGDDIGRGAGARGFREFDSSRRAERFRDALDGLNRFREKRPCGNSRRRPRCASPPMSARNSALTGSGGRVGAGRIVRVGPLHRVIGQREIADAARERAEMIEARDERKAARARQPAIGRLQAENPAERRRHPDRAVGVGAQRERHQPAADRGPNRRRSRRSCVSDHADCARGRHARSRR